MLVDSTVDILNPSGLEEEEGADHLVVEGAHFQEVEEEPIQEVVVVEGSEQIAGEEH